MQRNKNVGSPPLIHVLLLLQEKRSWTQNMLQLPRSFSKKVPLGVYAGRFGVKCWDLSPPWTIANILTSSSPMSSRMTFSLTSWPSRMSSWLLRMTTSTLFLKISCIKFSSVSQETLRSCQYLNVALLPPCMGLWRTRVQTPRTWWYIRLVASSHSMGSPCMPHHSAICMMTSLLSISRSGHSTCATSIICIKSAPTSKVSCPFVFSSIVSSSAMSLSFSFTSRQFTSILSRLCSSGLCDVSADISRPIRYFTCGISSWRMTHWRLYQCWQSPSCPSGEII